MNANKYLIGWMLLGYKLLDEIKDEKVRDNFCDEYKQIVKEELIKLMKKYNLKNIDEAKVYLEL